MAAELARELGSGDRVFLEGPLGAGKTTFARFLLESLGVSQPPEGSPTFAIAHEYFSRRGEVIHIDFYRLKSEAEIDAAGIPSYFWERDAIVISEWASQFPGFFEKASATAREGCRSWSVRLAFAAEAPGSSERRAVEIGKL